MKTYVLTLSKNFPASHPNAGQATNFGIEFIDREEFYSSNGGIHKTHTIRANYPFWEKRFEDIERGNGCLSVRQWSGKPYCSKQIELERLTKEDGIGLQQIRVDSDMTIAKIDKKQFNCYMVAHNDGLSYQDWLDWFKGEEV